MAFQVSPGVNVTEIDLTTGIPAVSTTTGAIAGVFNWGPVNEAVLIDTETTLVNRFGKPTVNNAETFFTAANFLAYGSALYVSRAANVLETANAELGTWTAVANVTGSYSTNSAFNVTTVDDYNSKIVAGTFNTVNPAVAYIAKWPGAIGDSLYISVCDSANAYSSNITAVTATSFTIGSSNATFSMSGSDGTTAQTAWNSITAGDYLTVGNSSIGYQKLQVISKGTIPATNALPLVFATNYSLISTVNMTGSVKRAWEFAASVSGAPGTSTYVENFGNNAAVDEVHVVVADQMGKFTGSPGAILEIYQGLSRAVDGKNSDGSTNYYKNVISNSSQYIWWTNDRNSGDSNTAVNIASVSASLPFSTAFTGGNDGVAESETDTDYLAMLIAAYGAYTSVDNIDINLVMAGKASGINGAQAANWLIEYISEARKDCVVFVSPPSSTVINQVGNELSNILTFAENVTFSSYAVMDTGYKYQYDKYNDLYRYVPLNGDIAGLCAYTDRVRDPWFSPAGLNRGQIKNLVKLSYNPTKADRDVLYPKGVNPVTTFPGLGTVLYGDKTLIKKTTAFSEIGIRRLFIVLEKAIASYAKYSLFEFNDSFTRSQFVSLVTPFLADVEGRRGIYDFKVVCDATNNTPQVIDAQQFVGDIYVKPAHSINYIQLNFVAVRTGVEFSEIVGKF